jgi:hypothetical protein
MDAELLKSLRYAAATSVSGDTGVNAFEKVIFSDDLPGEIASTQYTFVFSGPPTMDQGTANQGVDLTPVGLVQDLQLAGQRQIAPIAELGNRFYRHVAGRTNHSASMSRVVSKTANVIGMMYAWLLKGNPVFHQPPTAHQPPLLDKDGNELQYSLHVPSLDSDLLDIPFGLYVVKLTENGDLISAAYWERCLIAGYTEMVQSGQVMVMEQIQLVMSRVLPAPNLIGPLNEHSYQIGGAFKGSGSVNPSAQGSIFAAGSNEPLTSLSVVPPDSLLNLTPAQLAEAGIPGATGNASIIPNAAELAAGNINIGG